MKTPRCELNQDALAILNLAFVLFVSFVVTKWEMKTRLFTSQSQIAVEVNPSQPMACYQHPGSVGTDSET